MKQARLQQSVRYTGKHETGKITAASQVHTGKHETGKTTAAKEMYTQINGKQARLQQPKRCTHR